MQLSVFSFPFLWVNFCTVATPKKKKKNLVQILQRLSMGGKKCKSGHILRLKSHMSPYVDNEFLLVSRTS